MAQSRVERQALFAPVSEVSRRLQPRHLVEVTTHYAKAKVARVVGGVSHAVKENGGTAAAVALGAVAVFDAGRRSADDRTAQPGPTPSEAHLSSGDAGDAASSSAQPRRHTVTNSARAKALVGSFGDCCSAMLLAAHSSRPKRNVGCSEKSRTKSRTPPLNLSISTHRAPSWWRRRRLVSQDTPPRSSRSWLPSAALSAAQATVIRHHPDQVWQDDLVACAFKAEFFACEVMVGANG